MRFRFMAALALLFILFSSSFALAQKGGSKYRGDDRGAYFGNIAYARAHWESPRVYTRYGALPRNHRLPPGLQKQLIRRSYLPPVVLQRRVVPYPYPVYVNPYARPYYNRSPRTSIRVVIAF